MEIHKNEKSFTTKPRTWKLKDQDAVRKFQDKLNNLLEGDANLILESVDDKCKHLKINLLKVTEMFCGLS